MRRDVQLAIEHATTRCNCGLGPVECEHCREAILRSEVLRLTQLLADESRGGAAAVAPSDAEIEAWRRESEETLRDLIPPDGSISGLPERAWQLLGRGVQLMQRARGGAAAVAPSDAEIENQRIRMVAQFRAVKVLAALGEDCHSLASECEKGEVMVAETFALIARLRGGAR